MSTPTTTVAARPAPDAISDWIAGRRRASALRCVPLPWDELRDWRRSAGRLVHATGGFFALAGLRARGPGLAGGALEQPIVLQPEIGILGFLLRAGEAGPELLVQAKAEPGNVGDVQLAPTVQATVSNYTRLHGGAPTPYLSHFSAPPGRPPAGRVLADSRQSEQGTRFLAKYNRNATVALPGAGPEPASDAWRWLPAAALLARSARDYAVNTDARSVLATADWRGLAGPEGPFGRWRGRGGFGEELLRAWTSSRGPERRAGELRILRRLELARGRRAFETELVPLEALRGWEHRDSSLVDAGGRRLRVRGVRVRVRGREVEDWEQPLVESIGEGEVTLLCQRRAGRMQFLLRASAEVGFRERVQLGPALQLEGDERRRARAAGDDPLVGLADAGTARSLCVQSDEGGRFYRSTARYAVVELDEAARVPSSEDLVWATLGQLQGLARREGVLNNEARSAVSLLLAWL